MVYSIWMIANVALHLPPLFFSSRNEHINVLMHVQSNPSFRSPKPEHLQRLFNPFQERNSAKKYKGRYCRFVYLLYSWFLTSLLESHDVTCLLRLPSLTSVDFFLLGFWGLNPCNLHSWFFYKVIGSVLVCSFAYSTYEILDEEKSFSLVHKVPKHNAIIIEGTTIEVDTIKTSEVISCKVETLNCRMHISY